MAVKGHFSLMRFLDTFNMQFSVLETIESVFAAIQFILKEFMSPQRIAIPQ